MIAHSRWKRSMVILTLAATATPAHAWQQSDIAARQLAWEQKELKTSANRWMLTPVDVKSQKDPASPSERQARDLYWDRMIGASAPLSTPGAQPLPRPIVDAAPSPEIPETPRGVWIIGKFEGYRTLLSSSQRSIYTEIDLRVQHVFGHPNVPSIGEGALITVGRPGGTILAPWSGLVSYELHPHKYDYEPGHTYLVGSLPYYSPGDFCLDSLKATNPFFWDVTDGIVRSNSFEGRNRVADGVSKLDGQKLSDVTKALDEYFNAYYKNEN